MTPIIHSLQFIDADSNKRFLKSGRKKGCFYGIDGSDKRLLICEGFATGASLRMNQEGSVAVAFDAGNLLPVAEAFRAKYPNHEIVICADNDADSPTNTGVIKATEAAKAIEAKLIIPPITGDFNDYHTQGLDK